MKKVKLLNIWMRETGIVGAFKLAALHLIRKCNVKYEKKISFHLKGKGNRNFLVRANTSDINILEDILLSGGDECPGEYDFLFRRKNVKKAKVIIDAGANIGAFSVLADGYCKQARIIAVEPEKENFNMLVRNTEENNNTICLQMGIWRYKAKLKVQARETGAWGFVVNEALDGDIEAVGIYDLMEMYKLEYIDILKVDIEGSEVELLEGECGWLYKVGIIVMETHDRIRPGVTKYVDQKMKEYGFLCKVYGEDRVYYKLESGI